MKNNKEKLLSIKEKLKNLKIPFKELTSLTPEASKRRYYRFIDSKKKSIILCHYVDEARNFCLYTSLYKDNGLNVPEIYHIDKKNKLLFMEDLGGQSLLNIYKKNIPLKEEYIVLKKCINSILKIQKINKFDLDIKGITPYKFSGEDYFSEINKTNYYFLKKYLPNKPNFKQIKKLNNLFKKLISMLYRYQKKYGVLVHRDFHSKNIMLKNHQQLVPYLIDYQDSRVGPFSYDLVSLLEDSYIDLDEKIKNKLKRFFLKECLFDINEKDFSLIYDITKIQRIYKAIGSFCFVFYKYHNPYFLKHIHTCMSNIFRISNNHTIIQDIQMTLRDLYYEH